MRFDYKVKDKKGQLLKGVIEAINENAAVEALHTEDYSIIALRELGSRVISFDFGRTMNTRAKVPYRELIMFTRQLATMLANGMPIIHCLRIIRRQTDHKRMREAVIKIESDIESGLSMFESFSRHPRIFSPIYLSLIRAGEISGLLDGVLGSLGQHLEREHVMMTKIRNAAVYPLFICVVAVITVIILIVQVLPQMTEVITSAGLTLPSSTRFLLGMSAFFVHRGYVLALTAAITSCLFISWRKSAAGKILYDRILLLLPVVGKTTKMLIVARFTLTLSILMMAGTPILPALEVVEGTIGNEMIAKSLSRACDSIREGEPLHRPLEESGIFEPMVIQMIALGEQTGTLDKMLAYIAQYYERDLQNRLENLTALIEPALILVVALMVAGIMVAILQPMLELSNVAGL